MSKTEFKRLMLLDGYNVIYKLSQIGASEDRPLRERRNALISFMNQWKQRRHFSGKIAIVFDGRDGVFGGAGKSVYGIDCIFTKTKEEADDRIISIIKKHPDPSKIVVISEDNYVINNCKAYHVDIKPVTYLAETSRPKSNPGSGNQEAFDKRMNPHTRNKINNELKKEWGIED